MNKQELIDWANDIYNISESIAWSWYEEGDINIDDYWKKTFHAYSVRQEEIKEIVRYDK